MGKAIASAIIVLIIGVLTEGYLGAKGDFRGIGVILSIALMGGLIIYFNENKK